MSRKARWLIIPFIIAYSVMPIVSQLVSSTVSTYAYMLVAVITFVSIVCANGGDSVNYYFSELLPFILYILLSFFLRGNSLVEWGYGTLLFMLPVVICLDMQSNNLRYSKLAIWIFIVFAVTVGTTIVGLRQYAGAARYLATVSSSTDSTLQLLNWHNIGGYQLVYQVVLMYPLVIFAHKKKVIGLIPTVLIAAGVLYLTVVSEYTIAFLLCLISSFLIFLKRDLRSKDVFVLAVFSVLIVAFFDNWVSNVLESLANMTGSQNMYDRLNALAGGTTGLENAEDNRIYLYRQSWNTFLSYPILGTFLSGGWGIGGHSFILDYIARYGMLGASVLFCMYRKVYRLFVRPFKDREGYGYVVWTFIQAILLSFLNTGMWLEVLAFYMPVVVFGLFEHESEWNYE